MARRSSTSAATRSSASTTCVACSSTSPGPRGHVRVLRGRAERRGRGPRRRVLPQRRLLDRLRSRDDRARHVGTRRGDRRARRGREPRRRRRAVGPARGLGGGARTAACARFASATSRRSSGRRGSSSASATVDVAFGGAFYASLEERVEPAELPRLIELGRELKRELEAWQDVVHPLEPELRDIYGVVFWQEERESAVHAAERDGVRGRRGRPVAVRQRNIGATRAPRPLGSASARRRARPPQHRRHRAFTARVVGDAEVAGIPAVVTEVEGSAYRTGEHVFTLDPDDPLAEGFLLR